MNVWDKLAVKSGGGGMWDRVASDLREPALLSVAGLGVWAQVGVQPGGLWGEARNETLVLPREDADIWQAASEETLILPRGQGRSVWQVTSDQTNETITLGQKQPALWERLEDETLIVARSEDSVWEALPKIRDMARYKPVRALGWALKKLETAKGEPYWVLKNLRMGAYLRLTEQQVYLWNLMDGSRSVQDLAVENFLRYQVLSVEWLAGFLGQLQAKGFLITKGVNVYRATGQQLWRRSLNYWGKRLVGLLFRSELSIKAVDPFYGALYKLIGWVLFARPVQVLIWLVSLAGLPAFFYIGQRGELSLITGAGDSLGVGLAGLLVAEVFAIFAHESAHALTTKHYGRTVRRGGVGLYFGMVAFFMDTTDIWMEPRGPRLAVTWAGPLSGFFLGGLASLALLISPATPWAGLAYQFVTFCYGISLLNLNPLLKLDGYYMLMDWLEMPMLRERSIAFVRKELWSKLRKRERFNRDDLIYAVFGALALIWTALAVFSMVWLYGGALYGFIQELVGTTFAWVLLAIVVGFFVVRQARRQLAAWRLRRT